MAFITTGLTNGGLTTHFQVQYDGSLQQSAANPAGPEPARTNAFLAACEADYSLMTGWFGGIALDVNLPITVNITPNGGGAGWSLGSGNLTVTINPSTGGATILRYLLIAEITEQFMRAQGRGWYGDHTEGSEGEGLSRFLGAQFLTVNGLGQPPAGFENSNMWLNSPRADFVNNINLTDDGPDAPTGCSLLFIYYLFSQLGFSVNSIVAAGSPTLGGVYRNLTGDSGDPFPFFKYLLDSTFPGTSVITGPDLDNPFPLGLLSFWVDKSTFGRDEVQDVIQTNGGRFPNAFWLVLEGFNSTSFNALSVSIANFGGSFAALPGLTISRSATPIDFENPGSPNVPQRIRISYDITFTNATLAAFPIPGNTPSSRELHTSITIGGNPLTGSNAATVFELVAGADPYFTNVDPAQNNVFWLSQDLRVFTATPGMNTIPVPDGPVFTNDSVLGAFRYAQDLLTHLNNTYSSPGGIDPFQAKLPNQSAALTGDSSVNPLTFDFSNIFLPRVHANYNFAIARVRLRGTAGPAGAAQNVKVFFRLWSTQTADTDYQPTTSYLSLLDAQNLPASPLVGTDHQTLPFFATGNLPGNTDYMPGGVNNRTVEIQTGDSVWAYFGCFLNLYDSGNLIDGQPIQHWLNGTHHCIVAQIAYDDAPIINANGVLMNPENSDKLAQRNLQVTLSDNPGGPETHRIPQTFDIRPSQPLVNLAGSLLNYPDELMIDWGNIPAGSTANIYWPQVNALQVLQLASQLYATHLLSASDAHTIQCQVSQGVTYVPIPTGAGDNFAGLFTVDLPTTVINGQEFNITVRRITTRRNSEPDVNPTRLDVSASVMIRHKKDKNSRQKLTAEQYWGKRSPKNWRYVVGTFQVKIPVATEKEILFPEENTLAILKWRLQSMLPTSRWYPVLQRYVQYIAGRIDGLGGDSAAIKPSLQGLPPTIQDAPEAKGDFTGKVSEVIYDCFGEFSGFVLESCCSNHHSFKSHEKALGELVLRACRDRLTISVFVDKNEPHKICKIIIRC